MKKIVVLAAVALLVSACADRTTVGQTVLGAGAAAGGAALGSQFLGKRFGHNAGAAIGAGGGALLGAGVGAMFDPATKQAPPTVIYAQPQMQPPPVVAQNCNQYPDGSIVCQNNRGALYRVN